MNSLKNAVLRFLRSEDGPTATEYAFVVSLILVACLAGVTAFGVKVDGLFNTIRSILFS